nr:G-protein coupled receptor Mth2-like [Crassostrea gigas]
MVTLQIGLDSIEYFFVRIDEPCFKKNQMLSSHQFSGTIAVGFFIKQAVERVDFERQLFDIATKMKIFEIYPKFNLHLSLTMRTNQVHSNPYKIYLAEYFSRCTLPQFVKYQVVADRQHYRTVRISKLLTCVQVPLDFDEYRVNQQSGKLTVYGMDKIYDNDLFDNLPDGSARICADDFTLTVDKRDQDVFLSKITLILNVISILCLMISFLIYVFKKELRTFPGKLNMVLILSLILTLTVFQLSKFGSSQRVTCVGFGIALHYFWLMSFSTMTVISFHMYRIFKFSNIYTRNGFNNILIVYIGFITIFPCVVVVLNSIISWQISSGDGDIGYGNRRCFIDNTYSRLASFIIPIGVMCICSLFFFVRTIISIKSVPKVPGNQCVRNEFVIFCRLFTITGITWVLQIIDGFLPFSTFSYISSIINSLQGTAIFIAFSLNKRVMNCKCMARNDSHDNTQAKGQSTEESNTDVTRL